MANKVIMPKLGATMEEGVIDSWLLEVGDEVEEGDPIAEVQTDKITIEIEAEATGVLLEKLFDQGEAVPVQQVIAYIGEAGEKIDVLEQNNNAKSEGNFKKVNETDVNTVANNNDGSINQQFSNSIKVRRTPIANRLAAENDVLLSEVTGTGPLGRIQKKDVENHLKEKVNNITPLAQKIAMDTQTDTSTIVGSGKHGKIIKEDILAANRKDNKDTAKSKRNAFKGIRKVIADRMSESFYTAPHVTLHSEIDMTKCVSLRNELLPVIQEAEGIRISFNEIIVKATAFSLKKNPEINISLENNKEIIFHSNIHIGFAVAVPDGLVVPVLRNVDQKGLATLTKEAKTMAKQAREGLLSPDGMQGSTFTISNLGMYAVDGFTPIINQPNAAILGVGRIQEKPVFVNGVVEARSMMTLSLSFDHRIIDGAPAAKFLTDLKDVLEQPYKLMV